MRRTAVICASVGAVILLAASFRFTLAPLMVARLLILGAALGALVLYDIREHRIPNRIVLPAACVCAALSLAEGVHANPQLFTGMGLVVGLLCVGLVAPSVLGMGDVKLALLIVCALDTLAVVALAFTFEVYAMVAMFLLFERGRAAMKMSLPLAPITVAGCIIALLI
jgi:leader peptidase (prepilin peptidase) / N-methyltransferase